MKNYEGTIIKNIVNYLTIKRNNLQNAVDSGYFCDNKNMIESIYIIDNVLATIAIKKAEVKYKTALESLAK